MLPRRRPFAVYLCVTLIALILLSASGLGDWGVAHGQTAPGRHPGARAAEATPGPPGAGGAAGADRLTGLLPAPPISATSVVGLALTAVGLALIVVGAARNFRRRRVSATAPALGGGLGPADAKGEKLDER